MNMTPARVEQRRRNVAVIAAERRRATHCKRGHEWTPENTYVHGGKRQCRTCTLDRMWYWSRGLGMVA